MRKAAARFGLAAALAGFTAGCAFVDPAGLVRTGVNKARPSGWDKGKKEGWKGDEPPGLEKKDGEVPGGDGAPGNGKSGPPGQEKKNHGGK